MRKSPDPVRYFKTPAELRKWLRANHTTASELYIGFYKKAAGKAGITWPQSVAEALCFGWIDGVRRSVDADRYVIRFTPRKPGSTWSAVNARLVAELEAAGRMAPAGRAAFAARREARTRRYSYERDAVSLAPAMQKAFRKNPRAWDFFNQQPPGYRKKAIWWIMSAKKEDARNRRFARLLKTSAAGKRLA